MLFGFSNLAATQSTACPKLTNLSAELLRGCR